MSMETIVGQKLVNTWSIVKTTYCNKTIISSKLFNAKCYFNYVINIILQLATYITMSVHFILGYVVRRLVIINNQVLRKIKIAVKSDVKNWAYISLR